MEQIVKIPVVKKTFIYIALLMTLVWLLTGCSEDTSSPTVDKIRQVSVVTVKNEAFRETLSYVGFVEPEQMIPISPQIDGKVKSIKVTEGLVVKAGEVLLELEKTGATTDAMSTLYAPIDGVVAEVFATEGLLVGAGNPAVLLSTERQIMQIGVTDQDLLLIEDFRNPSITVMLNDEKVSATLLDLNRLPDATSRLYTIKILLDSSESFLLGQMGSVSFELSRMNGIWLPINWIQNDGEDYVYIVNSDNRIERRNIRLKELNNDRIRVDGLKTQDRVVTVGNNFVKEGQQVVAREATDE